MIFRIAGMIQESIVDGNGIRLVVFTQGCSHHCHNCQNLTTWDFNGGREIDTEEILKEYKKNPLLKGITISGGEPFESNLLAIEELIDKVHSYGGDVWVYTGYTYEELKLIKLKLLDKIDYLVDGPYIDSLRDLSLKFRGSSNQRIIKIRGEDNVKFDNG